MATSNTVARCPHCDAVPPESEVADGWCGSCDKQLPSSFQQRAKRNRPHGEPPPAKKPRGPLLLAGAAAVQCGVAAAVFFALRGG